MAGRNPSVAFRNYVRPIQAALQCITQLRLTLPKDKPIVVDRLYSVVLNDIDPVPLQGEIPLLFTAGQIVRVVKTELGDPRGPYKVNTVKYFYDLATSEDQELLSYHWDPELQGAGEIAFPHLHIGPALTGGQSAIRPKDLHTAHVPTSRVSLEAVIRLVISEFGVRPLKPGWSEILQRSEDAFMQWKTR